jgi:hypothetical protein
MIPISREVPNYKYFSYKVDYIPRNTKRKQKLSDNGDARIQVATPENNHIRVKFTAKLCFFWSEIDLFGGNISEKNSTDFASFFWFNQFLSSHPTVSDLP